ncbi:IS5 family transposase [Roseovarius tolerans]|nr:IS5 family transposase [Roseovarius tolerans]
MSDPEWEFIKAVLPNKTRGKKRVDDRRVINGMFYVLRTGTPWADLPSEYGPPTTVYNRFKRWSYAGHWDRIMDAIADANNVDTVMVDGTSVRTHHSTTTLKKDPRHCLGHSRGGLGEKIHALTNQDGLPIRYELTPGQAHDVPPCKTLLDNLQPRQDVLADNAYDADWIRDMI